MANGASVTIRVLNSADDLAAVEQKDWQSFLFLEYETDPWWTKSVDGIYQCGYTQRYFNRQTIMDVSATVPELVLHARMACGMGTWFGELVVKDGEVYKEVFCQAVRGEPIYG